MTEKMTEKKRNRRVLVTVSPSMYELIQTLGDEANVATSQLLGELVEKARPAFEAMLFAVRQAKSDQENAYDTLHRLLISAQNEANEAQLDLLDTKEKLRRSKK